MTLTDVSAERRDDVSAALEYYKAASGEIVGRHVVQNRIALAGIVALGVLLSQIRLIADEEIYWVYLGAAFIYATLGVLYLDQDRMIALLGLYRNDLEVRLAKQHGEVFQGWEAFRTDQMRDDRTISVVAGLYRYLPTVGISPILGAVYFYLISLSGGDYEFNAGEWIVITAWGAGQLCLLALVVQVQKLLRQMPRSGTRHVN